MASKNSKMIKKSPRGPIENALEDIQKTKEYKSQTDELKAVLVRVYLDGVKFGLEYGQKIYRIGTQ